MKKLLLIIISFFPLLSLAETLVTVYVTGSDGVSDVTKQIIGSELVSSIASNPNFRAIERTSEFLKEIQKERSNNEDQKLCAIGGKYGSDKICATNIMFYQNSYYIQARLIDVKQAIVESTAREVSELSSVEQIVSVAESLTSKLIGSTTKQFEKEYSTVLVSSNEECDIIYIDNTGSQTVVGFKLITPVNIQASFSQDSYIYDNETGKSYKVLGVSGIGSNNYQVITAGIKPFTVTFEKIPEATKKIDIIEPDGWYWKNISLVPYDKPNYFEFKDDTESKYPGIALKVQSQINQMQIQAQEEEERKRQELEQLNRAKESLTQSTAKLTSTIKEFAETVNSYVFEVSNKSKYQYKVIIDGHVLGAINAYKTQQFRISTQWYGLVQAVQLNGYTSSPKVYTYRIPQQQKKAYVKIDIK